MRAERGLQTGLHEWRPESSMMTILKYTCGRSEACRQMSMSGVLYFSCLLPSKCTSGQKEARTQISMSGVLNFFSGAFAGSFRPHMHILCLPSTMHILAEGGPQIDIILCFLKGSKVLKCSCRRPAHTWAGACVCCSHPWVYAHAGRWSRANRYTCMNTSPFYAIVSCAPTAIGTPLFVASPNLHGTWLHEGSALFEEPYIVHKSASFSHHHQMHMQAEGTPQTNKIDWALLIFVERLKKHIFKCTCRRPSHRYL